MAEKNALLVYPEFETSFWSFNNALKFLRKRSSMPPLGLLTLGNMFPKDYTVRLVDMNVHPLTDADLKWADAVFTSTMIVQRRSLDTVIARAKRAGKPVVAGGPHPTSYWEEMHGVDYFLLGEVEETFRSFLRDLENGTAQPMYIPKEKPAVTKTPPPRYDLINMRDYGSMVVQFSRGCPFDCEFCDITKLYGRVPRTKKPEQMLAEFELLYQRGWRGSTFLVDDNFIGNRRDALLLLKALIPWQKARGYPFEFYTEASMNLADLEELMDAMIQSGFTAVFVGIETPTAAALMTTKKKQNVDKDDPEYPLHAVQILQAKGFEVMGGFILGLDGDKEDAFDAHIKFIQEAGIPMAMEGILSVLKNTDLYFRMQKEGRLRGDTTGNNLGTHLNFTPEMDEETLKAGYTRVLNTIYDRTLAKYFARCQTMLERTNRRNAPTPQATYLSTAQKLHFIVRALQQLASAQGPAYLKFLRYVILHKPQALRHALWLAAKGYHLRKITEDSTISDSFQSYLSETLAKIIETLEQKATTSRENLDEFIRTICASITSRYRGVPQDFRPRADAAVQQFVEYIQNSLADYSEKFNNQLRQIINQPTQTN